MLIKTRFDYNKFCRVNYIDIAVLVEITQGAIAKWLQRQIRNLFLFEGAGSNPAGVGKLVDLFNFEVM